MGVWYTTLESVRRSLDYQETARNNVLVEECLETGSRNTESTLHRRFYPEVATRYFDWPSVQYIGTPSYRLWLGANELISLTTLANGGLTISPANYNLRNSVGREEPPYTFIELNQALGSVFTTTAGTAQRALGLTGVWGYDLNETPAGAAAEAMDASETGFDVTNSAALGTGSLLRVDSERMLVTSRDMLTTGQSLIGTVAATNAAQTLAVTDGTLYFVGETLLLDAERMIVTDISANNLIVKRAIDGTVLAAHTNSVIFAPRRLNVTRGALGTTAATHLTAASLVRHAYPGPVASLSLAYTIDELQQRSSGFARTVGEGENAREATGRGLAKLKREAIESHGRQARNRAV
jgi:hypothetical protein